MADRDLAISVLIKISAAGNIALFLAQTPMIFQMVKERDATKYTWLPSLTLMSTMSLWSGYGLYLYSPTDRLDIYVGNFSGVAIPFVNLVIFMVLSKTWAARARIMAATALSLAATWGFTVGIFTTLPLGTAVSISGAMCVASNCTFFFSPLKAIREAVLTLDASRVPLTLSVVQVFQSLPWIVGTALLGDPYIMWVNIVGEILALSQVSGVLYIRWRRSQLGLGPGQAWKGEGLEAGGAGVARVLGPDQEQANGGLTLAAVHPADSPHNETP